MILPQGYVGCRLTSANLAPPYRPMYGPTPQGGLSLPLWGNSPSAHIGPPCAGLARLPWKPFLYLLSCHASGGPLSERPERGEKKKSRLSGDDDFPALTIHPLKRPRRGNCDSPFLELPPGCSTGRFSAAGAYAVTPPPHRPVCEKTGERRWNVGAGLVPARRGFPQRRGIEATTRAAPTVAQNRERICRYPARLSGRRVVISLPPVYTTVSERFFLTFHPVEGVW